METRGAANNSLKRVFWNHRVDEAQLVAEAAAFPANAGLLDPFVVTELDSVLTKLPREEWVVGQIVQGVKQRLPIEKRTSP